MLGGWNRTTPPGGGDILGKDPQLHMSKRESQLAAAGLHKWESQGSEMGYSTVLAIWSRKWGLAMRWGKRDKSQALGNWQILLPEGGTRQDL